MDDRTGAGFHECLEGDALSGFVGELRRRDSSQLVKDVWQQLADRDVVHARRMGSIWSVTAELVGQRAGLVHRRGRERVGLERYAQRGNTHVRVGLERIRCQVGAATRSRF